MIRDNKVTFEARQIALEIWDKLKLQGRSEKGFPDIDSKQGGRCGCYYPNEHCIRVRTNMWNKMVLAQKRLLLCHELVHALGQHTHSVYAFYLYYSDMLSIEMYKNVWGEDEAFNGLMKGVKEFYKMKIGG